MRARLVALDDGPDIPLDRAMVIVGRHPQCDARLDSIRVSRRHCCMTQDNGDLVVRDLGSTNGIRINGQRVEMGRLRPGDELSIAHIRYRLDSGQGQERTQADPYPAELRRSDGGEDPAGPIIAAMRRRTPFPINADDPDNPLALAVREMLPVGMAERCRIQVIVQMNPDACSSSDDVPRVEEAPDLCRHDSSH